MIIHFPHMHAELSDRPLFEGELLFDPGTVSTDSEAGEGPARFRPDNLPIDSKMLGRMVADFLRFGEQFKNIHDLADLKGASAVSDKSASGKPTPDESERAIRAGLTQALSGSPVSGASEGNSDEDDLRTAQLILALAWTMEEKLVESMDVEQGLADAMSRLRDGLGLDEENLDEDVMELGKVTSGQNLPDFKDYLLPWRNILGALLRFVPSKAVVVVSDPDAAASLEDAGIAFAERSDLPAGLKGAEVRAGDLVRASAEAGDWADKQVIAAVRA